MWKFSTVLFLLALASTVNSNETPTRRMCAVCLEMDCATRVRRIYPADSDTPVWPKENSQTAIHNCCMENLKPDAPCKMANGSLVQLADNPLRFYGLDTSGVWRPFHSQISPCADLNLPPSSTPSPVTKTPIHNTPTLAAPNISGIIIGSVIGSVIVIGFIGFLIWKRNRRGQGQDRVPAHDPEDRNENTIQIQPPNVEVPNENVNRVHREDDSVGPEGYLDDSPL